MQRSRQRAGGQRIPGDVPRSGVTRRPRRAANIGLDVLHGFTRLFRPTWLRRYDFALVTAQGRHLCVLLATSVMIRYASMRLRRAALRRIALDSINHSELLCALKLRRDMQNGGGDPRKRRLSCLTDCRYCDFLLNLLKFAMLAGKTYMHGVMSTKLHIHLLNYTMLIIGTCISNLNNRCTDD